MIDRIWWIWQMQDPDNRMNVLSGNAPVNDTIDLKWTAEIAKSYDLTNNIGGHDGQLCYIYV
jgi:tyrosinase